MGSEGSGIETPPRSKSVNEGRGPLQQEPNVLGDPPLSEAWRRHVKCVDSRRTLVRLSPEETLGVEATGDRTDRRR